MNLNQSTSAKNANTENIPITALNVEGLEYVSTRKPKVPVNYVRALLCVNMVAINNSVMIVGQLASVDMENVVAAVKNVPEAPFALIRSSEADVVIVEVVKYVSMLGVVNCALNVTAVPSVLINYDVTDALNVEAEIYANTVKTRTGVSHVMVKMSANIIKSKHNVSHVMADLFALIKNVVVSVGSA